MPAVTTTFLLTLAANLPEIFLTSVSSLWPAKVKLEDDEMGLDSQFRKDFEDFNPVNRTRGTCDPNDHTIH